jgi:hypothetical protein
MTTTTPNRHPDCTEPATCRVQSIGTRSTLLGYKPTYDGDGHLLNGSPNRQKQSYECRTCGRKWTRITKAGEVAYEDGWT